MIISLHFLTSEYLNKKPFSGNLFNTFPKVRNRTLHERKCDVKH